MSRALAPEGVRYAIRDRFRLETTVNLGVFLLCRQAPAIKFIPEAAIVSVIAIFRQL